MKNSRLYSPLFSRAALLAVWVVSAAAPVAASAAEKIKSPSDRFELSWSHVPSPELKFALEHLKSVEARFQSGNAPKEELLGIRQQIDALERRASYRLTLVSKGGSLREFMTATSGADEVSFTLINAGEPADLDTELPPFNLRNAHWGTIVEVLANFLATRDLQLKLAGSDQPNPAESRSVVCVLRRIGPGPEARRGSAAAFDSFPLAPYLATTSIDDIVSAIRSGWELDPAHDKDALRLKFHPATAILLVSGPPEAMMVASKIVSQLKPAQKPETRSAPPTGEALKR